jgi:hypothetical protein
MLLAWSIAAARRIGGKPKLREWIAVQGDHEDM